MLERLPVAQKLLHLVLVWVELLINMDFGECECCGSCRLF
jgi:hypothetical protein